MCTQLHVYIWVFWKETSDWKFLAKRCKMLCFGDIPAGVKVNRILKMSSDLLCDSRRSKIERQPDTTEQIFLSVKRLVGRDSGDGAAFLHPIHSTQAFQFGQRVCHPHHSVTLFTQKSPSKLSSVKLLEFLGKIAPWRLNIWRNFRDWTSKSCVFHLLALLVEVIRAVNSHWILS